MTIRFLLAGGALDAGCATSPPSRYYTLSGPPAPAASPPGAMAIVVGPVAIPAVVDRPEIVITIGDNEVWLDEFNRWAAPLADAIAIATAENLAGRADHASASRCSRNVGHRRRLSGRDRSAAVRVRARDRTRSSTPSTACDGRADGRSADRPHDGARER